MSRPTDEQIVAYFDQCQALIRDHGWMVQGVFPTDDPAHDDLAYPFCYTIGLAQKTGCELLMIGDIEVCTAVLDAVATKLVNGWLLPMAHGNLMSDSVAWKGELRARGPVDDVAGGTPVHMARNYYAWSELQAVADELVVFQIEWPNPDGKFLDDGAADDGTVSPQLPMRGLVTP